MRGVVVCIVVTRHFEIFVSYFILQTREKRFSNAFYTKGYSKTGLLNGRLGGSKECLHFCEKAQSRKICNQD